MATNPAKQTPPGDWTAMRHDSVQTFHNGATKDPVVDFYNRWAKKDYDGLFQDATFNREDYESPKKLQQAMQDLFPTGRDTAVLLDVGAGTGLSGQMLRDSGFKIIDGLEPAEEMLRVAKKKQIFRHTYTDYLTDKPTDIPADSYDCVTLVGVISYGHLPCAAFTELTRIVKPGGYIVNCMRKNFITEVEDYNQNWPPLRAKMEKEGRWKFIKYETYHKHYSGYDGLLMVIQVLK